MAITNAKRKPVDSQFMVEMETPKYCDAVAETGAKVNQSQETTMLRRESWMRPKKRRLYRRGGVSEDGVVSGSLSL